MDDADRRPSGPRDAGPQGRAAAPLQPAVIGIALAAVLTVSLAQGSWEWFSTYIGATLLAVILFFSHLPPWSPGLRSPYGRSLAAYSLIVGLCVAITLAPLLQRSAWLFPMPGARRACPALGRYEGSRMAAGPAYPGGRAGADLRYARGVQEHVAVADCLAATTTRWLPVYGGATAVLVALGTWSVGRARTRRAGGRPRSPDAS